MRLISCTAIAVLVCLSTGTQALPLAFANQEGGLIPSPSDPRELRSREFRDAVIQTALQHCASYDRIAYITGVVPGYGNYISFTCRFAPGYDPVKQGKSFWSLFR
jgi:hypothetical protein